MSEQVKKTPCCVANSIRSKKVPPVRRHLVEKRYWFEVFPERSVYLIGYFNPNRGLCGVALGIGYLQPDFM
jgi:hypothetical protein